MIPPIGFEMAEYLAATYSEKGVENPKFVTATLLPDWRAVRIADINNWFMDNPKQRSRMLALVNEQTGPTKYDLKYSFGSIRKRSLESHSIQLESQVEHDMNFQNITYHRMSQVFRAYLIAPEVIDFRETPTRETVQQAYRSLQKYGFSMLGPASDYASPLADERIVRVGARVRLQGFLSNPVLVYFYYQKQDAELHRKKFLEIHGSINGGLFHDAYFHLFRVASRDAVSKMIQSNRNILAA